MEQSESIGGKFGPLGSPGGLLGGGDGIQRMKRTWVKREGKHCRGEGRACRADLFGLGQGGWWAGAEGGRPGWGRGRGCKKAF